MEAGKVVGDGRAVDVNNVGDGGAVERDPSSGCDLGAPDGACDASDLLPLTSRGGSRVKHRPSTVVVTPTRVVALFLRKGGSSSGDIGVDDAVVVGLRCNGGGSREETTCSTGAVWTRGGDDDWLPPAVDV